MKTKCKVCTVMCDISRGNELRACAFEHNGDENICPFDARYLDLSEHDKQIRADAIEEYDRWLSTYNVTTDYYNHRIMVDRGGIKRYASDLYLEQMKEQNNG